MCLFFSNLELPLIFNDVHIRADGRINRNAVMTLSSI